METVDATIKEIRKQMMATPESEYFELSRTTINYLLNNIQRYRAIETEMRKRTVGSIDPAIKELLKSTEIATVVSIRPKDNKDE